MTPEQQTIFIRAAQLGMACGLGSVFEWYVNTDRALFHGPWDELDARSLALADAFAAFMRGCGACPGDPVETLTSAGWVAMVDAWYSARPAARVGEETAS